MRARGFSRTDLIVTLVVVAVLLLLLPVVVGAIQRSRWCAVQLKDSTQQRNLMMGLEQWMQASGDRWPLAYADSGWDRNTTADLYQGMIFQQLVTPKMLVAPGPWERNPRIHPLRPGETFSVDVSGNAPSHVSYAHLEPSEARLRFFASRSATMPVFSSRFPDVAGITERNEGSVTTPLVNPKSYCMGRGGDRSRWTGNMAFADGHVEFRDYLHDGVTSDDGLGPWLSSYKADDGHAWPDLPYLDEEDDETGTNQFLGIFIKAGRERGDFVAVYD